MQEIKTNTELGELTVVLVEDNKGRGYTSFFKDTRTNMVACGDSDEEAIENLRNLLTTVLKYEERRQEIDSFFDKILNEEEDIVERNSFVYLKFNELRTQEKFILIEETLGEFLKVKVHPSLIKSALIITSGIENEEIKLMRINVENHLKEILGL